MSSEKSTRSGEDIEFSQRNDNFKVINILCTTPIGGIGEEMANRLVEKRLAACVNILKDVQSVYWWEGQIVRDKEDLLVIKSREELYPELEREIKSHHPYTVPEILILPVRGGNKEYLRWVLEETNSGLEDNS